MGRVCYDSVFTPQRKKAKRCIYMEVRSSASLILSKDYYKFFKAQEVYMPMPG